MSFNLVKPIYLLVTPFFPSATSWRGAFGYDFVKALVKDGRYEVVVFKPGVSYEYEGIAVRGYWHVVLPSGMPCPLLDVVNKWIFKCALRKFGIDLKRVAIADAFVNGMVNETRVVKEANPETILVTHHHDLASYGVSVGRFRHFYPFKLINFFRMRKLQSMVDLHVFISEAVKRSFERFPDTGWTVHKEYRKIGRGLGIFKGVKPKNSIVLHNGVDSSLFFALRLQAVWRPISRSFSISCPCLTIGCVANFQELKDHITLLRAVNILQREGRKIKVVCVGSGETLEKCKKFASERMLDVEFRTEVRHEKLVDFYNEIDLFVLPSYFEGFGCVYLEAAACGVPFIGCEGQGVEDVIAPEDRKVWLCRQRDPEDLADKIRNYIENRPQQRLVGEIDINKLVARYLDQLEAMKR